MLSCSGWPTGDRTLRLWDVATGKKIRRFDTQAVPLNPGLSGEREAPGEFVNLAVTPDGPRGPRYRVQPGVIESARSRLRERLTVAHKKASE